VSGSGSTPESIASRLVGVWKLVSYTVEQEGQEDGLPFGGEPEGFLIYTPEGFVSAQLMKPGRSLFQGHDWQGGTADEYQQAGSGYIAYCGSYEVDQENETVTHTPAVALVPNLILKPQLRSITLVGERLTLRAVIPMTNGASATSLLEWQRAGGKGATHEPRSQDEGV
jgi:Lipocalin-like domain